MDKLEKVIQAFENCMAPVKCRDCPWEDCETADCKRLDIPLSMAIAALELLKAKEPIEPEEIINDKYPVGDSNRYGGWLCGKCKEGIPWDADYCPYCGHEVKWNE